MGEKTRENIIWVGGIGLVVAIVGAAIWDWLKNEYSASKNKFKKWYNSKFRKKENQ